TSAGHHHELALAHAWDYPEHRRIDQARAFRFDQRSELAAGHRLQRAHLDEQLAGDIAGEEAVVAAEQLSHSSVFGDDRDDDVGPSRAGARADNDTRASARACAGSRVPTIPSDDLELMLRESLRDRRAHAAETHQADLHVTDLPTGRNRQVRRS